MKNVSQKLPWIKFMFRSTALPFWKGGWLIKFTLERPFISLEGRATARVVQWLWLKSVHQKSWLSRNQEAFNPKTPEKSIIQENLYIVLLQKCYCSSVLLDRTHRVRGIREGCIERATIGRHHRAVVLRVKTTDENFISSLARLCACTPAPFPFFLSIPRPSTSSCWQASINRIGYGLKMKTFSTHELWNFVLFQTNSNRIQV